MCEDAKNSGQVLNKRSGCATMGATGEPVRITREHLEKMRRNAIELERLCAALLGYPERMTERQWRSSARHE